MPEGSIPKKVEQIAKSLKRDNPSWNEEKVWSIAWSTYNKMSEENMNESMMSSLDLAFKNAIKKLYKGRAKNITQSDEHDTMGYEFQVDGKTFHIAVVKNDVELHSDKEKKIQGWNIRKFIDIYESMDTSLSVGDKVEAPTGLDEITQVKVDALSDLAGGKLEVIYIGESKVELAIDRFRVFEGTVTVPVDYVTESTKEVVAKMLSIDTRTREVEFSDGKISYYAPQRVVGKDALKDPENYTGKEYKLKVRSVQGNTTVISATLNESINEYSVQGEYLGLRQDIAEFLRKNPVPNDKEVHEFAASLGVEPEELEREIYALLADMLSRNPLP